MDVLDKVITKVIGLPHKPLSNAVFWLGLIIIIYLLAQITWGLVPTSTQTVAWKPTPVSANQNGSANVDLVSFKKLDLFGKYDKENTQKVEGNTPTQITDAPKSSLSIQLTGVVASTTKKNGLAIIASSGTQATYSIGDKIKGTSASLKEVYADRIIITNAGRYETVMLDGLKFTTDVANNKPLQTASRNKAKKIDKSKDRRVSADLAKTRQAILADPNKITDYLSISPKTVNGQLQGYRLNPGKDRKIFREAGFKPNDLAKSLNGYDLTDISQALEVMSQLQELTQVSIIVEREGQLVELTLGLPQ
ncbi:type II secretion system protein GspC [Shewanella sp. 202IG2-18]|uniref:type II secretion system protein GspC n=1 Tax=Parashewanella hymeniacidonis TaxID=2807618 RepID=UPI0019611692|nr:type II secretion system protein GspC [Parashewanella hymeniacidonis]MBM7071105.1 type II secretion system protein GspC [Parashewanella hymeniacidonis]